MITVLFGLAVITILFTSASRLTLTHARLTSDQIALSSRMPQLESLAHLALAARQAEGGDVVTFMHGDNRITARFEDVGARVDLNAGSPALLEKLLTGLGIEDASGALDRFRTWRRSGYRLQRVSDFARVSGISEDEMARLAPHVTVFSGRPGFAPDSASLGLLEIVTGQSGSRDYLASQVPVPFRSPLTGVNYRLRFGGVETEDLVVYLPPDPSAVRLLAVAR